MSAPRFRLSRLAVRLLTLVAIASAGLALTTSRIEPQALATISEQIDTSAGYAVSLFSAIAAATLVTEDLTCIASGMLVGEGLLPFWFATLACMAGIFVGDVLLFLAGRALGRRALRFRIIRALVTEERVRDASDWLTQRGFKVILISRFMPGTRLPVYFAAGVLDTSIVAFSKWFLAAVAIWTPILVALAAQWNRFASRIDFGLAALAAAASALLIWLGSLDRRSKRLLLGRWRRLTRWEFWPTWFFYLPVVGWTLVLAVRHRCARCFMAVNPAIPGGGIIGESKSSILNSLSGCEEYLPKATLLESPRGTASRMTQLTSFIERNGLTFPVVLKPDAGQRGSGVVIARSETGVRSYLDAYGGSILVQEFVPGEELGVFYVRHPESELGSIFSITRKAFIGVTGDGSRTLEELILDDDRAVCQAPVHLSRHRDRLREIPPSGQRVPLVDLGTHCRGALFTNGDDLETPALSEAIDRISRSFEGFYFGRYDVRGDSIEAIQAGRFKVIELNGVTSEATAIYDPSNTLLAAWATLFRQWSLAFEIGAYNARHGHSVASLSSIVTSIRSYREQSRNHPAPVTPP